jgi:uncharacterized membrane protein
VHNTYFTLPVIIAMLSNHYGMVYQHPQNWLVLILLMLAGALTACSSCSSTRRRRAGNWPPGPWPCW